GGWSARRARTRSDHSRLFHPSEGVAGPQQVAAGQATELVIDPPCCAMADRTARNRAHGPLHVEYESAFYCESVSWITLSYTPPTKNGALCNPWKRSRAG